MRNITGKSQQYPHYLSAKIGMLMQKLILTHSHVGWVLFLDLSLCKRCLLAIKNVYSTIILKSVFSNWQILSTWTLACSHGSIFRVESHSFRLHAKENSRRQDVILSDLKIWEQLNGRFPNDMLKVCWSLDSVIVGAFGLSRKLQWYFMEHYDLSQHHAYL